MRRFSTPLASAFALAALLPLGLSAQAPVVTADGDPSVRDDTIYALAVEPADYPDEDFILLFDDGVVVGEEDGRGSRTYRMAAQVLTREGVDSWAEHTFGFDGDREQFRLNWIRVLDLEGNVISDEPIHQQTMDLPVPEQNPVYTNWKVVRVSMAGVEPGTIVDYSYTVETLEPVREGDHFSSWSITTGGTVLRSRLVLDVPEDSDFRLREEHVDFEPRVEVVDGRRVREWYVADQEFIQPETYSALAESDILRRVAVSGPSEWSEIGSWYAELAGDRYTPDDATRAAFETMVADLETPEQKLRALYRWVAQDFRYISISLGQGGYQPREAAEVFRTRSGDCKDKATLFIGLARELGYDAYPVLLSSYGGVETDLPSVRQFDHVIAAVRVDGEWVYLDLTAEIIPFAEVSPSYQGEFGLIVMDDGGVEEITFPENPSERNRGWTSIRGRLADDGSFTGWYEEGASGALQYELRSTFSQPFTERQLEQVADAIAANVLEGATGDSLSIFDGRDLEAAPLARVRLQASRAARENSGIGWIMPLPVGRFAAEPTIAALEREMETRRTPIDVGQVIGGAIVREVHIDIELPEGWDVALPESHVIHSDFGSYESLYTFEDGVFRMRRTIRGWNGTEPAERIPELIDFLEAAGSDDASYLVLTPPSSGRER